MIAMRCSKKRALILFVIGVIVTVTITACVLFISPLIKKIEEIPQADKLSKKSEPQKSPRCDGKDCQMISYPFAEEALTRKSCASENCVLAAARMLKWLDKKVDPCEDFYNFSCGNFIHSNSLPEGWNSYGSEDVANEEIDLAIKSIIEEPVKVNESDSLVRAKSVYRSCLDITQIEEFSARDLKQVLSSKGIGDWPLLQPEWNDCRLDVEWKMAKLNALGIDSLFRLEAQFSGEENSLHAFLSVAPPLVEDICEDDGDNLTIAMEKAKEHREILNSVLSLLDVEINNVTEKDVEDVYEFDLMLCNVTKVLRGKRSTKLENMERNFTLLKLADLAPQINWIQWRNHVFSELRLNFPHDKLNIYVDGVESAIEGINDLLHSSTSKVLANYLTWKFVLRHLGFLGKSFRQILENHSELLGRKTDPLLMNSDRWIPRWRQCVIYVKDLMPMAILQKYRSFVFNGERKKEMQDVMARVTNEFRIILKDTRDLLQNDRMRSSHKIDKMEFDLAYPEKEDKYFNSYYSHMGLIGESFLLNGMKLRLFRMRKLMEGVSTSKTSRDLEYAIQLKFSAFSPKVYSSFQENQIVVTFGALQASQISPTLPKFMIMSTFGWAIGHELTHGFDLLALDGATASNWTSWPTYVIKNAKSKAQCFLEFFPGYEHKNVNEAIENSTLNEDLCDSQGMHLAFKAYLNYLSKRGEEEILPGLPISSQRLFFLSYAQQFCEIRREQRASNPYSPGRRRVNQVLRNFAPFSEAFRCKSGKPMNYPKCDNLWH